MADDSEKMVEAIEEGKIVRVTETYARLEGLTVLRRAEGFEWGDKNYYQKQSTLNIPQKKTEQPTHKRHSINLEPYRKPLKYNENDIASSLVHNFHWLLTERRKSRNMTRKQLAAAIGDSENSIKMLENGLIPSNDYILITKLERYFGISLRKDGKDFNTSFTNIVRGTAAKNEPAKEAAPASTSEDEIELIE